MRTLAAKQHGLVSVAEATELGANPVLIHRLVRRGLVTRIGPRSLTFPGQPETWRMMLAAALNEAGEDAVISHRAAACLHRFDGFGEGPVEVTTSLAHRNRKAIGLLHTSAALPLADRCKVDGFPCTTPARTVVDLAGSCSLVELENAVDSVIRNGGASVDFLTRVLARRRGRGHYGGPKLDTVLVDAGGTNKLERRFLRLCRQARLPRPACQIVHKRGTQTVARVDFDFAPSKLVVEVEGQIGHASPQQRQRDAKRRRDLLALGRIALPFTYEDVFHRPSLVLEQVTETLARCSASSQIS
jgi:very-short-patch-repair endonuclease